MVLREVIKLWKEDKRVTKREKGIYYASEVFTHPFVQWCRYHNVEPTQYREEFYDYYMFVGDSVHKAIQEKLFKQGWTGEEEYVWQEKTFKIVGHPDLISPDKKKVLELKIVGNTTFSRIPKEQHIAQLITYLMMTKINKGELVYINRVNGKVKIFRYELNNFAINLFNKILKYWHLVNKVVNIDDPVKAWEVIQRTEWAEKNKKQIVDYGYFEYWYKNVQPYIQDYKKNLKVS